MKANLTPWAIGPILWMSDLSLFRGVGHRFIKEKEKQNKVTSLLRSKIKSILSIRTEAAYCLEGFLASLGSPWRRGLICAVVLAKTPRICTYNRDSRCCGIANYRSGEFKWRIELSHCTEALCGRSYSSLPIEFRNTYSTPISARGRHVASHCSRYVHIISH